MVISKQRKAMEKVRACVRLEYMKCGKKWRDFFFFVVVGNNLRICMTKIDRQSILSAPTAILINDCFKHKHSSS